jgi:CDP-diacylglycerol--glycerol-3-phosphate 3-phosphatidyltransferase/cardiolipin synthase
MGNYRLAHLFLVPNLISLTRVPFAALFMFVVDSPGAALGVLLLSGLSDVADGWYARRFGQATATGAVVDGLTDKAFMGSVVGTLLMSDKLTLLGAVELATRELGELPLVIWWALRREKRGARADNPKANALGKLCTTIQFAAVAGALIGTPWLALLLHISAALGVIAAAHYWLREVRA